MISARLTNVGPFMASLADKAERLAKAAAENRLRATRADTSRWRRANLLWPLFTKD